MRRVLVVDDEEPIRDLLRAFLEDEGYQVQAVRNGVEALTALDTFRPDLVLTDLMMPVMDGREMLRLLGELNPPVGIPIIVMSAASRPNLDGVRFNSIITKPFDLDLMLTTVEECLR